MLPRNENTPSSPLPPVVKEEDPQAVAQTATDVDSTESSDRVPTIPNLASIQPNPPSSASHGASDAIVGTAISSQANASARVSEASEASEHGTTVNECRTDGQTADELRQVADNIAAKRRLASAIDGGREVSQKILYVGNLSKLVSDENLQALFSKYGTIKSQKILNDKNNPGMNYAFIEYISLAHAAQALESMNGVLIQGDTVKIKYAYHSTNANSVQSSEPVFNIFVGDLSPEVNDDILKSAFAKFKSIREAHVMWDMQTSRSRGYGFVTFLSQDDAQLAINSMNGQKIHGRVIRCNWGSHRQQQMQTKKSAHKSFPLGLQPNLQPNLQARIQSGLQPQYPHIGQLSQQQLPLQLNITGLAIPLSMASTQFISQQPLLLLLHHQHPRNDVNALSTIGTPHAPGGLGPGLATAPIIGDLVHKFGAMEIAETYEEVLRQAASWQTTVYLGNIAHSLKQADFIPLVSTFGYVVDFKFHPEKGCAFVKYNTHENAALAIVHLAGYTVHGRPLKCGWGRERKPRT